MITQLICMSGAHQCKNLAVKETHLSFGGAENLELQSQCHCYDMPISSFFHLHGYTALSQHRAEFTAFHSTKGMLKRFCHIPVIIMLQG